MGRFEICGRAVNGYFPKFSLRILYLHVTKILAESTFTFVEKLLGKIHVVFYNLLGGIFAVAYGAKFSDPPYAHLCGTKRLLSGIWNSHEGIDSTDHLH